MVNLELYVKQLNARNSIQKSYITDPLIGLLSKIIEKVLTQMKFLFCTSAKQVQLKECPNIVLKSWNMTPSPLIET